MEKKPVRPAVAAFMLVITMTLLSTALSFFVIPVCDSLNFKRGSFAIYYSLMVAAGAVSASFLGTYLGKNDPRKVMLFSAVWCFVGYWCFSLSSALWMFYLVGAAMGLFGSTCIYLAANVIVQQSYSSEDASAVLGVVMAGSGVGGVVWSNLVPRLLETIGWRFTYRVLGCCWLLLVTGAILMLGKPVRAETSGKEETSQEGMSRKEAMKTPQFYLLAVTVCVVCFATYISSQLPALLQNQGYRGNQISRLVSVMTASIAVGTTAQGVICKKMGALKTMKAILVIYVSGYVMMALNVLPYVALPFLAFGAGSTGTVLPMVVQARFGRKDYAAIWSVMITFTSIVGFFGTPTWGAVYDIFGSYQPALIAVPILLVIAAVTLHLGFKKDF